jgi:hypothetical protein
MNGATVMNTSNDKVTAILRTLQIIHGAMVAGPAILLGIIAYLLHQQGRGLVPPENLTPLTLVALAGFVAAIPLSFLVPRAVLGSALGRIAAGTWQVPNYRDARVMAAPGPTTPS